MTTSTYNVLNGETSSGITLTSGDFEYVSSGGTAISTTVSSGGVEVVSSGGTASFTMVSNGGTVAVSLGGTTTSTTLSGGTEYVYSGGTVSFTTVSGGGNENVSSGGTAISTTLRGGTEYVYSGGTASFTTVSAGGTEANNDGKTIGTVVSTGGNEEVFSGGTLIGTTLSGGTEFVFSGTASSTVVNGSGTQDVNAHGSAISTTVNSGGHEFVFLSGTANDTTVNNGGFENVSSGGTASDPTVNSGGTEYLRAGAIASGTTVEIGGTIDATYIPYVTGGVPTLSSTDMLTISQGGQSYELQLSGTYTNDIFNLAPDTSSGSGGTLITVAAAPCYRSGTRILTDRGEIAVEHLRVGDLVKTVLGEGLAPIIWIGHRHVDCARHPKPEQVWPIRVAAGAFSRGRPHTDLFLSPDHAVYVNEVLIPIRHLVNGSTIAQVPMDHVTYHHIELPQHDVVLAEGLPAESFLDMEDGSDYDMKHRNNYANAPGPIRLYPDFSIRIWEALGCAPLIVSGPDLAAARALVGRFAATQSAA